MFFSCRWMFLATTLHLTTTNLFVDWYTNKIPNFEVALSPQFQLHTINESTLTLVISYSTGEKIPIVNSERESPVHTGLPPFTTPAGLADMTFTWHTETGFLRSSDNYISLGPGKVRSKITKARCEQHRTFYRTHCAPTGPIVRFRHTFYMPARNRSDLNVLYCSHQVQLFYSGCTIHTKTSFRFNIENLWKINYFYFVGFLRPELEVLQVPVKTTFWIYHHFYHQEKQHQKNYQFLIRCSNQFGATVLWQARKLSEYPTRTITSWSHVKTVHTSSFTTQEI